MDWFGKKKKSKEPLVQTAARNGADDGFFFLRKGSASLLERGLYRCLREQVPVVDAALAKIVRLLGTFRVRMKDPAAEKEINRFLQELRVNGSQRGIDSFLAIQLDQLLTYGTAVGEMVVRPGGREIIGLYNASLENVGLSVSNHPLEVEFRVKGADGEEHPVPYPSLILCSTINNEPGQAYGTSVLRGLPFVGELLMKIFHAVGTNWDRIGNVRFAVSYKPGENDRSFTKERAAQIASEWSKAMKSREPKDFVTVGDVSIRVIGADNQIPDSQVPVRMLMEQLVAKLSIPPFLLGLCWSSTERMSSQQADILTSELEYYRRSLEGCIRQICDLYWRLQGCQETYSIEWDNINLQDEVELARAALLRAQAAGLQQKTSAEADKAGG